MNPISSLSISALPLNNNASGNNLSSPTNHIASEITHRQTNSSISTQLNPQSFIFEESPIQTLGEDFNIIDNKGKKLKII